MYQEKELKGKEGLQTNQHQSNVGTPPIQLASVIGNQAMLQLMGLKKEEKKPNTTGIPDQMKQSFEERSGLSFDDVKVHYNSDKPAQLQALAYTQGNQVYVGPGQEKHLGHELGHVVQQKQGRVRATTNVNGVAVNDNKGLEREADGLWETMTLSVLHRKEDTLNILPYARLKTKDTQSEVIQCLDEDAQDPYERGTLDSPKVHHIIPHSHLIARHNDIANQNTQTLVKKRFMPDANQLTIRQLGTIFRNWLFTNAESTYKHNNSIETWVENPLTSNGTVTIAGGAPFDNVNSFITIYNSYKNAPSIVLSSEQATAMETLSDSYYLWPSGNLFYGPDNRIEPGGAVQNFFDTDAEYFKGKPHVAYLRFLHNNLMNADGNDAIRDALFAIADYVKNVGFGAMHEPNRWINMQGDLKTAFLIFNVGSRENHLRTHDGILPKDFVRETLNGTSKIDYTYTKIVVDYIKVGPNIPAQIAGITVNRTLKNRYANIYKTTITFHFSGDTFTFRSNNAPTISVLQNTLNSAIKTFILHHL